MFKTLGALAVSMTVTTVVLSQLEPDAPAARSQPVAERTQRSVRSAVITSESIATDAWSGFEILSEWELAGGLDGEPTPPGEVGEFHFWVGRTGMVLSSSEWSEQRRAVSGLPVRIVLEGGTPESGAAPGQSASLCRLLVELRNVLGSEPGGRSAPRPVGLSDNLVRDDHLLDLLRSQGWSVRSVERSSPWEALVAGLTGVELSQAVMSTTIPR